MAQATVTLATTTTTAFVGRDDRVVTLASLAGVTPDICLFVDDELMCVDQLRGVGNDVVVLRGTGGTAAGIHGAGATVYIGRPDQFYEQDPKGVPPVPPLVLPYINVTAGTFWQPSGDEDGPSKFGRTWKEIVKFSYTSSLGVNQFADGEDL